MGVANYILSPLLNNLIVPSRRDVAVKAMAAVLPVISRGVGVHGRGKRTQVLPAQCDFAY